MSSVNQQPTSTSETSSQDLWTQALNTLDDDLRSRLDLTTLSRNNILSIALREAQEKKEALHSEMLEVQKA